jgi:hypothetical protein
MSAGIKLLDVVALTEDLPERKLQRGQVGTVVEPLAPDVFEVECFCQPGPARKTATGPSLRTGRGGLTLSPSFAKTKSTASILPLLLTCKSSKP